MLLLQTDVFELEAVDLGRVRQLVVGHDGRGEGNGWYLETVTVQPLAFESSDTDDTTSEGRVVFYCGKCVLSSHSFRALTCLQARSQSHCSAASLLRRWLDEGENDGKVVRELDPMPATGPTLDQLRHNLLVRSLVN